MPSLKTIKEDLIVLLHTVGPLDWDHFIRVAEQARATEAVEREKAANDEVLRDLREELAPNYKVGYVVEVGALYEIVYADNDSRVGMLTYHGSEYEKPWSLTYDMDARGTTAKRFRTPLEALDR